MSFNIQRIKQAPVNIDGKPRISERKRVKKQKALEAKRNDTQVATKGTHIPGTPVKFSWEKVREERRNEVGTGKVEDAITKERRASKDSNVYKVKSGDTLWDIAESCRDNGDFKGKSVPNIVKILVKHNNLKDNGMIFADQEIEIPSMKPNLPKIKNKSPYFQDKLATLQRL